MLTHLISTLVATEKATLFVSDSSWATTGPCLMSRNNEKIAPTLANDTKDPMLTLSPASKENFVLERAEQPPRFKNSPGGLSDPLSPQLSQVLGKGQDVPQAPGPRSCHISASSSEQHPKGT